jgi:hypothetical protein
MRVLQRTLRAAGETARKGILGFVFKLRLFNAHVLEFAGLKDLTALQTLYEFKVLIARDDLHPGVLTLVHLVLLSGIRTAEFGS